MNEDDETFEKIHDHYAQIYLETKNFIDEIKGDLENGRNRRNKKNTK